MSRNILLIEDNEQNRYLATFLLEQRGYRIASACDGPTGISMARAEAPDLILLDIQLPLMNGYEVARELAQIASRVPRDQNGMRQFVVCSGGGPSIMEAANRGAADVGAESIGLNIVLPHEQAPNPYVTPSLSFQFHYFALRKMHFLLRARALAAFPGGFGTFDELFELLTLIQTGKIKPIPVLLFGREFWDKVVNFQALVDEGVVSQRDLGIFTYVETAEEAWDVVREFYEEQARAEG